MSLDGLRNVPYGGDQFCRAFAARVLARRGIPMSGAASPADAKDWQRVSRPQADDVVVFNRDGRPAHVGVCLGRGRFVHVEEGGRSRIDRLASPLFSGSIEGIYRYTGERMQCA